MDFGDDLPGFDKPGNTGFNGGDRDGVRFRRGIPSSGHQACHRPGRLDTLKVLGSSPLGASATRCPFGHGGARVRLRSVFQKLSTLLVGAGAAVFISWRKLDIDAETARIALNSLLGLFLLLAAFVILSVLAGI